MQRQKAEKGVRNGGGSSSKALVKQVRGGSGGTLWFYTAVVDVWGADGMMYSKSSLHVVSRSTNITTG